MPVLVELFENRFQRDYFEPRKDTHRHTSCYFSCKVSQVPCEYPNEVSKVYQKF